MSDEPLMSAFELIDVTPVPLDYQGHRVTVETGRALAHAVRDEHLNALCGKAVRRLTPTFWRWEAAHPEHISRCAACLELFPLRATIELGGVTGPPGWEPPVAQPPHPVPLPGGEE